MTLTERGFQDRIAEIARMFDWRVTHFGVGQSNKGWRTPVRYDGKGFPDLVLVHAARGLVLFREVKAARGSLAPEQQAWGVLLEAAGADYGVWRPKDWPQICELLSAGRVQLPLEGTK